MVRGQGIGHQGLGDKLKRTLILKEAQEWFYMEENLVLVTYSVPGEEQEATLNSEKTTNLSSPTLLIGEIIRAEEIVVFSSQETVRFSEHP